MTTTRHVINLDIPPYLSSGWFYDENHQIECRARGTFVWNHEDIRLHLSTKQLPHGTENQFPTLITGYDLKKELSISKLPVLGANVLDYLLSRYDLIPDEWKGKIVFFWGTIFRHADGRLYVHCLCWTGGRWHRTYEHLDADWHSHSPAAVLI